MSDTLEDEISYALKEAKIMTFGTKMKKEDVLQIAERLSGVPLFMIEYYNEKRKVL